MNELLAGLFPSGMILRAQTGPRRSNLTVMMVWCPLCSWLPLWYASVIRPAGRGQQTHQQNNQQSTVFLISIDYNNDKNKTNLETKSNVSVSTYKSNDKKSKKKNHHLMVFN
jgi:hypothetical protein